MAEAGIRWVRVDFDWPIVEPEKGKFSLDRYEEIYDACKEYGLNILGILTYSPSWASSAPPNSTGVTVSHSPPRNVTEFAEYVRKTVKHFAGRIKYWEIWNEPNIGFFLGTADQYRRCSKLHMPLQKRRTRTALCFSAAPRALASTSLRRFARRATLGNASTFSTFATIPRSQKETTTSNSETQLASPGGWERRRSGSQRREGGAFGDQQAAFLARAFLISLTLRNKGVNRVFWYQMFYDPREAGASLRERQQAAVLLRVQDPHPPTEGRPGAGGNGEDKGRVCQRADICP